MKSAAIVLFLIALASFGIGLSAVFLGWPHVGFEAASGFFAYGTIIGSVCGLAAFFLLAYVLFQRH